MPRLNKNGRTLLIKLVLTSIILSACASKIPAAPAGELYSIDIPDKVLLCTETADGKTCPEIPIDKADKFYAMTPAYWKALSDYIDILIERLKAKSPLDGSDGVVLMSNDVQRFKDRMDFLAATLKRRRSDGGE
jgi:hypothetical protein